MVLLRRGDCNCSGIGRIGGGMNAAQTALVIAELQARGVPASLEPPPKKAFFMGSNDHKNGIAQRSENQHYLDGYNSFEPVMVVSRVGDNHPQYSVAKTYHPELPEWYESPSQALYYSRANEDKTKFYFTERVDEWKRLNPTFESLVENDLVNFPDVPRLYQSTIDGGLSTSIDGGKTWFFGGIMDYPDMPTVHIKETVMRYYTAHSWYIKNPFPVEVIRTTPKSFEFRHGTLKLKPPKPVFTMQDPDDWYSEHIRRSEYEYRQHLTEQIQAYNARKIDPTAEQPVHKENCFSEKDSKGYYKEWQCPCYQNYLKKYHAAEQRYQQALEKWQNL
jgi:hypothetical protein